MLIKKRNYIRGIEWDSKAEEGRKKKDYLYFSQLENITNMAGSFM